MTLSDKLKRMRSKQGLSQAGLAEKSGVAPGTIANIEGGRQSQQLRPGTFRKLASALGVPTEYFLTDDPKEYVRVRIATLTEAEGALLDGPESRLRWLLSDLVDKWGDPFDLVHLGERIGVGPSFLQAVLEGDAELSGYLLDAIGSDVGVPGAWFMTGEAEPRVKRLSERYEEVLLLAQAAGIDPDLLKQQIEILRAIATRGG